MLNIIKAVASPIFSVLDQFVEDKDKRNEIKAAINGKLLSLDEEELKAKASIIIAEASGESWIQRNWRPVTMLTFVGLIVAHWLGFTAENLPEAQVLALLDIVKIGLGGYVLSRGAEKVAKSWNK